ncbi:MAG: hypothetical protein P8X96_06420 [Desulfobacteraceae bacterium]
MEKSDIVDLIFKAAAIYLFVLAVIAILSALEAAVGLFIVSGVSYGKLFDEISIAQAALPSLISSSIGGILKFVIYIVAGRNLFNGGSWVRRLFGKKVLPQN